MSKYTPEQLKEMAIIVMQDKTERSLTLILTVAGITGLNPNEVKRRIAEYANA